MDIQLHICCGYSFNIITIIIKQDKFVLSRTILKVKFKKLSNKIYTTHMQLMKTHIFYLQ